MSSHQAMITVRRVAEGDLMAFDVVVRDGRGETHHHVTASPEVCERLTGGKRTPEECIQAAFSFLLDREAKESILQRFDVTVISRYFPEFERELPRYFSPP
jgi:hypothetical protein